MRARTEAFIEAEMLCLQYANSLQHDKPELAEVAAECAAIISEASEGVLTIEEIGDGSCQELSSFLVAPAIDYTSGLLRK